MTRPLPDHLPPALWRSREGLEDLCRALGSAEGEARFVGGAVRDGLLGLDVSDVDIATLHLPDAVMERVRDAGFRAVPTGIAHGTVTAVVDHRPVEITTLRKDVSTDGRRATVEFGTDWRDDAARRDFTFNALYADPLSGALFDYFDGRADLAAARVRFIGDPHQRIAEDHLRILRYFRFTARFGKIDRSAADYLACVSRADSLKALSRERISDELMKLLALPDPGDVVEAMIEDGVLAPVLPEVERDAIAALRQLMDRERETGFAPDPVRRLLALLPDDADAADRVAARLRLSNRLRARMAAVLNRMEAQSPEALAYRVGLVPAIDQILLGFRFTPDAAKALEGWPVPRLPLTGGDLIAMGLEPGPVVARTLQAVEQAWIDANFPGEPAARSIAAQLVERTLRSAQ